MDERLLENYLGFGDADLAANRDGAFSSGQRGRLVWSGIWRLVLGPPIAIVGVVIALASDLAFIMVSGLAIAAVGLYLAWRGFAFLTDAIVARVAFVSGPMRKKLVQGRYGTTYYAVIGPVSKRVSSRAYASLREGIAFHLYYSPGCRSLLSLEPASAAQPKPDHGFGPDSAHAWNRLRWAWVAITIGAVGLLVGAHDLVLAHPAHTQIIESSVTNYVETHGKSTGRHVYVAGYPNAFTPDSESSYDPPAPGFSSLIGEAVVLYVDPDTGEILAMRIGKTLHTSDWFRHPEHKTVFEAANATITAGLSALAIIGGVVGLVVARRRPPDPLRPLYAPPSVHQPQVAVPATAAILAVAVVTFFALVVLSHH